VYANNNDADGNKSGPQRFSAAAPSAGFHHPSSLPSLFPRPASYSYFRLPAGIEEAGGSSSRGDANTGEVGI